MKAIFESQELARRFNEDEAVWQRFEQKRSLRQMFSRDSVFSDELLDDLDWSESELEAREPRCIGRTLPWVRPTPESIG